MQFEYSNRHHTFSIMVGEVPSRDLVSVLKCLVIKVFLCVHTNLGSRLMNDAAFFQPGSGKLTFR